MSGTESLTAALRQNADLTEKSIAFMSDVDQIEEAKADITLWLKGANAIEAAQVVLEAAREHEVPYALAEALIALRRALDV